MPRWEETVLGSRGRYERVIQALADKYPSENLLFVTHGKCYFRTYPLHQFLMYPFLISVSSCFTSLMPLLSCKAF